MNIASEAMPYCIVGVFLVNPESNKVLLAKDKESNKYTIPLGLLEFGDEWEECASRKVLEDTGITISNERLRHISTMNCFDHENENHSIAIFLYGEINSEAFELKNDYFFTDFEFLKKNYETLIFNMKVFLLKYPNIRSVKDFSKIIKVKY